MPRKAKDEEITKLNTVKSKQASKSITKNTPKKAAQEKKTSSKKTETKEIIDKKVTKKASSAKSTTTKKVTSAKASSKSSSTKKSQAKTSSKKSSTTRKTTKKLASTLEYYDLPAVYNKTIIKILAQTPSCLFVYWEIAEQDRLNLEKIYGNTLFQDTKPYLVIINETMNYSFEVEVNDYANSWYIHIGDSDCKYEVKLIRKPIIAKLQDYNNSNIDIISSNDIDLPNDHILFDKLGKTVFFKNVKTSIVTEKELTSLTFISNIGKIYNIYDFYKRIYKDELNGNEFAMGLSSSQFSSLFK